MCTKSQKDDQNHKNLNYARIISRVTPVFLSKKCPYFALIFTKRSPYDNLGTLQSEFERYMSSQGSFKHCFIILQQCLTLFSRGTLKYNNFCRKTLKYDTFCCNNLDPALTLFRHYF